MKQIILVGNRTSALIPLIEKGQPIKAVYSIKESRLSEAAQKFGIPNYEIKDKEDFLEKIKKELFDILISAGCPYIIPAECFVEGKVFLNLHPSLLPYFPGTHAITEALYRSGPYGVTLHTMGEEVDSGNLVLQKKIKLKRRISAPASYKRIFEEEQALFNQFISEFKHWYVMDFGALPYLSPVKSNFNRDYEFRLLNSIKSRSEIEKRVRCLSCEGHYARYLSEEGELVEIKKVISPSLKTWHHLLNPKSEYITLETDSGKILGVRVSRGSG